MRLEPGTATTFGPPGGVLTLHTTCTGAASRLGHDLTLLVGEWRAVVTPTDADCVDIRLTAELSSLAVERATGGVKPLSGRDRRTIVHNALATLKARDHPAVLVSLDGVRVDAPEATGDAVIAGATHPVTVAVTKTGTTVLARAVLRQTDFGLVPYSTMLGALRVNDAVAVTLVVEEP